MSDQTPSIKTISDLVKVSTHYNATIKGHKYTVLVCSGAGCVSSNCHLVKDALLKSLKENSLQEDVYVIETGCIGTCSLGPVMVFLPEETLYTKLSPTDIPAIVKSHLIDHKIKVDKTYVNPQTGEHILCMKDISFFREQVKIALRNCGSIEHSSIEAYIAKEGYFAIAKALTDMTPSQVVEEVKMSGLRGRGGAGFPTGVKWEAGKNIEADQKYIVCNADEGDPGAFMDRSILEGDPHSVIEGMMLGAYAIGANKGYVYVRAEYPLAVERLSHAIELAHQVGLLGKNILQTPFDFDLEIRIGAGAFVCGEETALMASIEGERGEPRQKPPFPFQKGLYEKPTIINNVETFANIPPIIQNGNKWYAKFGTEKSKGTKVFALAGDITNTGIIEVPMGTSLGDILFKIGGGIPRKKAFKAAQTGGPSGGCITKKYLNTPVDYESLTALGAIMGSGGLISMDEDTCMVDMARFFMEFVQDESCGKCVPCRTGTKRMLEILERITQGKGQVGDIELLEELGETIQTTALCGLGQTAPNPILSTIKNFREEYEEHINHKYCRAGVCGDLFISPCSNACPAGVNIPGYIALISVGRLRDAYNLIRQENPFPAVCGRVCTHPCESKCRRAQLDEAIAIADLKRYVADYVLKHEEPYADLIFPRNGKCVGIVGAGPSGLTCGYYLARLGYMVDIYESMPVAGGILAFGIPEYRLPAEVLQHEINLIKQAGVTIHLKMEVGEDVLFEDLRQKHNALYLATGTQFSNKVNVPGEDLKGVIHGLNFLRDVHLGKDVQIGDHVIVIGGGNTALDAARVAIRRGAKEVSILYRRTIEDMPADAREVHDALEEGIKIIPLVTPIRFNGEGHVNEVEAIRMELGEFDESGRRKPRPIEGSEFSIHADLVIPAVSQYADLPFIGKDALQVTPWGTFITHKDSMMTNIEGVFAGGDVVRGSDVAITAIADGKNAAKSIDKYLGGTGEMNTGETIEIPLPLADEQEIIEHERFTMKFLEPELRKNSFDEVAVGFHKLNAMAESMRCLRCDRRG